MLDLGFLVQGVQLPLWFVLVLAGYQRVIAMMRRRGSAQARKETSGRVDVDEDGRNLPETSP